jgi:3-hydroxyisobutyrate dehydrogenase-like beta-hydroxyacid dehydrogenase
MRVGSIGGGGMGSLLIRNLSQNDIPCIVSDISDKALENVGSAQKTKDNKQVAKESDVLFFSLPHDNLESAV